MAVIAYQYRGELVDQIHRGHIAVTDHTGRILWKLGDPERLTFARSSAKPLQAIPVAESGALEHYGITPQELAVIGGHGTGAPQKIHGLHTLIGVLCVQVQRAQEARHYLLRGVPGQILKFCQRSGQRVQSHLHSSAFLSFFI